MNELIRKTYFCLARIKYNLFRKNIQIRYRVNILPGSVLHGYNVIEKGTEFSGMLGHDSYIGCNSTIYANIGNYCSIGDRVHCVFASHPTSKFVSTSPVFFSTNKQTGRTFVDTQLYNEVQLQPNMNVPVIIENDVWVGSDVTFIGRVRVGNGAIIAAGAVVNKDVLPYSIVGGVPARIIKKRFCEEEEKFLLELQWWDKDIAWIEKYKDRFSDILSLITALGDKINE